MTVTVAWIRNVKGCEELYVVSDSRLSGNGMIWDECKKLSILPRGDAFLSFAGNTDVAYPLLSQVESTISGYNRSMSRFMDICDVKGHLLNVINQLTSKIDFSGFSNPEKHKKEAFEHIEFLFGGYSWIKKRFEVWRIRLDRHSDKFVTDSMYNSKPYGSIIFAGDKKMKL